MKKQLLLSLFSALLLVFGNPMVGGGQATDLIISEYGEGSSGNSKYVEIYNGTGSSIDLSDYQIWKISNGGSWPESTYTLSNILADGATYVVANNSSNTPGADDYNSSITSWNGNDPVGLAKNISSVWTLIDVVGEDGPDPGTGWDVGGTTNATKDHRLTRKSTICSPNTDWDASRGTTIANSEWTLSTYTSGSANAGHTASCASSTDTEVEFTTATSTVAEDGSFIDVCASITNPSASAATTVDITLTGGTASNGTDYDDGATLPSLPAAIVFPYELTFPANSSTDQCLRIYVNDNILVDGDRTIDLGLANISGGSGTPSIGTEDEHTVTIEDNDAPLISLSSVSATTFCVGSGATAAVDVDYLVVGIILPGNSYTAQLSDASGDFTTPTDIGSVTNALLTDTINATIPASATAGTGYRIRVIASSPATFGGDNGTDITIENFAAPTDLSASCGNTDATVTWTNPSCFDEVMLVASDAAFTGALPSAPPTVYTANASFTGAGTAFDGGKVVYKGTGTTETITDLTNGTTYNFRIFARKGDTWVAGSTESCAPTAPVTCEELFISEYLEGSGTDNKYIEIYNPTASAINLSTGNYSLRLYSNGDATPTQSSNLSGTIAAFGTMVFQHGGSGGSYTGTATTDGSVINFNGDDAIALAKNGSNIDIFGRIGDDPGSQWSLGGNNTQDQTLVRNADVLAGVEVNPTGTGAGAFTTLSTEWTEYAQDDVSDLGSHTCDCFVNFPVVTLSINTTTGTEAGTTQIILTATADAAVTGNQTVEVTLSGTGVAVTDFTGVDFTATVNITILSGATTGTLTFNVADDAIAESTETATFTIGSPSSGIVIGTPNAVDLDISDNDNLLSSESVIIEQGGEAANISSLNNGTILSNTDGVQVWHFRLYDGDGTTNDADDKPTLYKGWTITKGAGNTVPDWDAAIESRKFFLGTNSAPIGGGGITNANNIPFLISSPYITVPDNGSVDIYMRLTLKTTLPSGSDGQHFAFKLDAADVTVDADVLTYSQLGTFTQESDPAKNGIDILATLQFIDAPAAVTVGSNFSITVSAVDANGNVDTGVSNSITLSLTNGIGTLSGAPATYPLVNGTYIFVGLNHDTEEIIEITVHDNDNVFADLTANINVTDEPHQLFDDFNRADNNTVGIPSSGGSTAWTEDGLFSNEAHRLAIDGNELYLGGCVAGSSSGSSGSTGMEQVRFNGATLYETTYDNAGSQLEWLFNMRQTRSTPSGFGGSTYAAAVVLGSDENDFESVSADGYAVVIGNGGSPDPVKLIRFTDGLSTDLNVTDVAVSGQNNADNYYSVKVTYDPCTGLWSLYVRDDGSSAFAAPNVGSLGTAVTGTDQTHTVLDLKYFGAGWQHSSSCGEYLRVDNLNIPNATSATTTAKVWNGSVNDNWNVANNWGPCSGVPTIADDVEIPNVATQPIISAATPVAVCKNLTVDAGATLTINSNRELTADGNVTNNGTVYVNESGSFIQTQNGITAHAGSGTFVVKRQSVGGFNGWSSPVVNGNLPGNNGYFYNSAAGTSDPTDDNAPLPDPGWVSHSGAMTSGKGYYASNGGLATFTGIANNGNVNIGVTQETAATPDLPGTRYNLVGNPYPSAIDADLFINDNNSVIDGSLYFWDDDNTGPGNYSLNDYATYSLAGATPTFGGSNGSGPTPTGSIASGQGFFVSCISTGTVNFSNGQRGGTNSQFFRMAAPNTQRIWLSMSNTNLQLFNQTLVAFDEYATDQKDWGVDALKFRGNKNISIAAQQDGETYAIATYSAIPQSGKVIPLMTYVEAAGTYTFVADSMEGFDSHNVYLEDLSNGSLYTLTQGDSYSFALTSADEYNRFQLWFSPMLVTGVNEAEDSFSIYSTFNNAIVVETTSAENMSGTIEIIDMAGRKVLTNNIFVANGIGRIQTSSIAKGIYALTFVSANGEIRTSQKVALGR